MSQTYRLTLQNDLGQVAIAADWLSARAADLELTRARTFEMGVCLEEAIANIIRFAYPRGGKHDISLSIHALDCSIDIVVEDGGVSFNPLELDPPERHLNLESFPIGGLGVHLMRCLARGLDYERVSQRNRLTISFDRP